MPMKVYSTCITPSNDIPKTKVPTPWPDNKVEPPLIAPLIASFSRLKDSVNLSSNANVKLLRSPFSSY